MDERDWTLKGMLSTWPSDNGAATSPQPAASISSYGGAFCTDKMLLKQSSAGVSNATSKRRPPSKHATGLPGEWARGKEQGGVIGSPERPRRPVSRVTSVAQLRAGSKSTGSMREGCLTGLDLPRLTELSRSARHASAGALDFEDETPALEAPRPPRHRRDHEEEHSKMLAYLDKLMVEDEMEARTLTEVAKPPPLRVMIDDSPQLETASPFAGSLGMVSRRPIRRGASVLNLDNVRAAATMTPTPASCPVHHTAAGSMPYLFPGPKSTAPGSSGGNSSTASLSPMSNRKMSVILHKVTDEGALTASSRMHLPLSEDLRSPEHSQGGTLGQMVPRRHGPVRRTQTVMALATMQGQPTSPLGFLSPVRDPGLLMDQLDNVQLAREFWEEGNVPRHGPRALRR